MLPIATSMDSSQRALQIDRKLFSIRFQIFGRKPKFFQKKYQGVNIDQIAMCYISMDSSERALQTDEKLFSNFELVFEFLAENLKFFKRITRRVYCSNCNVLYINGFVSTSSTNYCNFFSNFKFLKFFPKTEKYSNK